MNDIHNLLNDYILIKHENLSKADIVDILECQNNIDVNIIISFVEFILNVG